MLNFLRGKIYSIIAFKVHNFYFLAYLPKFQLNLVAAKTTVSSYSDCKLWHVLSHKRNLLLELMCSLMTPLNHYATSENISSSTYATRVSEVNTR